MSKYIYSTTVSETEIDAQGNTLADYDTHLPHKDTIAKKMTDSWNSMHMEQYYDEILKDKIDSDVMSCKENVHGELVAKITFTMKPGVRLTEKYRRAIADQTSAQMSDGWGESFFGYNNIMTDGTIHFIAE